MKRSVKAILKPFLFLGSPFTFLATLWLKLVKKAGPTALDDKIFMRSGILPVADHYYQPLINPKKHLERSLRDDRELPAIDLNMQEQLDLLASFTYNEELIKFPLAKTKEVAFYYENDSYSFGDAEYLYSMIRHSKPRRIIEIGSGYSTLMTRNAINANKLSDPAYTCRHICIEPYEQPWLKEIEVELKREKVERIELSFFQQLEAGDILFIDSSHVIRPQGDVLFEYLEILPILKPGVLIQVHDIFTPKDYLDKWIYDDHCLWNEQYLLEAFLSFNREFRIIGALNYLAHHHTGKFTAKCPLFAKHTGEEPGAFWIIKNDK